MQEASSSSGCQGNLQTLSTSFQLQAMKRPADAEPAEENGQARGCKLRCGQQLFATTTTSSTAADCCCCCCCCCYCYTTTTTTSTTTAATTTTTTTTTTSTSTTTDGEAVHLFEVVLEPLTSSMCSRHCETPRTCTFPQEAVCWSGVL